MHFSKEYITSELFIHDNLIIKMEDALKTLAESYRTRGCIEPFLFLWPADDVETDEGTVVNDTVLLELPLERMKWPALLVAAVKRTKAYALCLVQETVAGASALLESRHGTHLWTYHKEYRGGYYTLTLAEKKRNEEYLGVLWTPPSLH